MLSISNYNIHLLYQNLKEILAKCIRIRKEFQHGEATRNGSKGNKKLQYAVWNLGGGRKKIPYQPWQWVSCKDMIHKRYEIRGLKNIITRHARKVDKGIHSNSYKSFENEKSNEEKNKGADYIHPSFFPVTKRCRTPLPILDPQNTRLSIYGIYLWSIFAILL